MARNRLAPVGAFGRLVFERMKERRHENGSEYSSDEFAAIIGVATGKTVRDYITGKSRPKSAGTWIRVAQGLGLPVGALLILTVGADTSHISAPERALFEQAIQTLPPTVQRALRDEWRAATLQAEDEDETATSAVADRLKSKRKRRGG